MILQIHKLEKIHIPFIAKVYEENLSELHGVFIPLSEWAECLLNDPDPDELNYVAFLNGKEAAWLKINGISSEIYFTSGGSESDNMIIKGIAIANRRNGNHIVSTRNGTSCCIK